MQQTLRVWPPLSAKSSRLICWRTHATFHLTALSTDWTSFGEGASSSTTDVAPTASPTTCCATRHCDAFRLRGSHPFIDGSLLRWRAELAMTPKQVGSQTTTSKQD